MAGAPYWWFAVDLRLGQALRRPTSRFVRAGPEKGLCMCPFHIVPSLHEVYRTVFLCFILSFVCAGILCPVGTKSLPTACRGDLLAVARGQEAGITL